MLVHCCLTYFHFTVKKPLCNHLLSRLLVLLSPSIICFLPFFFSVYFLPSSSIAVFAVAASLLFSLPYRQKVHSDSELQLLATVLRRLSMEGWGSVGRVDRGDLGVETLNLRDVTYL